MLLSQLIRKRYYKTLGTSVISLAAPCIHLTITYESSSAMIKKKNHGKL